MKKVLVVLTVLIGLGISLFLVGCPGKPKDDGPIQDEAMKAGRDAASFPGADEDYFADMDRGATKNPEQVRADLDPFVSGISAEDAVKRAAIGRNNWIVWTAGNDLFWDYLSVESFGNLDLLKTLSSHPSMKYYSRDNRWEFLGLVNEPCFTKATGPRADRWGLWLDSRDADCQYGPDPFENTEKYPGVETGARGQEVADGKVLEVGSYYGYATGIVGLRLFTNPAFDKAAAAKWDPERYYTDPTYYLDKNLVKPYRVGMSCGFCHVGPDPTNPPADPENPLFENLTSNPGAQYFWIDRIFMWDPDETSFVHQLFGTSRPGALDTSLVSTDNINNPRTMNAVYSLAARLEIATKTGKENLAGGGLNNKQFNDYVDSGPLTDFYSAPSTVYTPRVLKDGADSVGALGALNRVFVNIGLFSEEWVTHFRPLVGGKRVTPFPIASAQKNSAMWNATEAQTPDTALFFLATAKPDYLKDAPGHEAYLTEDDATLARGKEVFATTCARCHSSKLPEKSYGYFTDKGCVGPNYLDCWGKYWEWTKTEEFKTEMKAMVAADDFLEGNFLSTELRVPVTLLETNACSPLATNAIKDGIWDNFSSQSYKDLPSVGTIKIRDPFTGDEKDFAMPAGGRGYTRPASLISLWSTAPYLLNNAVGPFRWEGSVEARMDSFDKSIRQMLWPETREMDSVLGDEGVYLIDRTEGTTYLKVAPGFLPDFIAKVVEKKYPENFEGDMFKIGPIPSGTPINLLANLNVTPEDESGLADLPRRLQVIEVLIKGIKDLKKLDIDASDEEAAAQYQNLIQPLLNLSKCPDFEVNRGHYFGTDKFEQEEGLSDEDKEALIGFLKTL